LSLLIMFPKYLKLLTPIYDFHFTFKSCGFLLLSDVYMIIYLIFLSFTSKPIFRCFMIMYESYQIVCLQCIVKSFSRRRSYHVLT
jgi:hypothetical protein